MLQALPAQLNPVSAVIDAEFKETKNLAVANDLAIAKTHIWSAGKATTPKGAADSVLSAKTSIANAARKLSGSKTSSAIRLADANVRLKAIYTALKGPTGG